MEMRVREVPRDLHLAFKLTCTAKEITMNEAIVTLMAEYVKREGKVQYSGRKAS